MVPSSPQNDPNRGKVLAGTYEIRRLLGEGGMGKVYEAGHLRLTKKRYAVKLLNAGVADDAEAYARFRREAEIATEIGHPHIVEVHDFNVTDEGQPFMVMEYLDGEDLYDYIKRSRRLPLEEVIAIMDQVGGALAAAHGRGIIHRDLKPENIFLARTTDGGYQVKLLDFGLSKIKHSRSRLTRQNAIFGTPQYMAPEQARGQTGDVDHRTDIFALGVIVYQCLTGVVPFDAPTDLGVLYVVCTETPPPPSSIVEDLPPALDTILGRAMSKKREDRYQDVQQLVTELVALAEPAQLQAGPLQSIASKPRPRVSAGVIEGVPEERKPQLPPGAPPLPDEALHDVDPPVLVSRSLAQPPARHHSGSDPAARPPIGGVVSGEIQIESKRPGIHNLETARKKINRKDDGPPSIHDLETEERDALGPETDPLSIHDLSTGEVAPVAEEAAGAVIGSVVVSEDGSSIEETVPHQLVALDRQSVDGTAPALRSPPARTQHAIAVAIIAFVLTGIFVTAVWLIASYK